MYRSIIMLTAVVTATVAFSKSDVSACFAAPDANSRMGYAPAWGFYAHEKINALAVYLLPPEMLVLYKPAAHYLREHATDPDKRRYIVRAEGPRHFIDLDRYGEFPFEALPRQWDSAVKKFGADSLEAHGVLPWRIQQVMAMLTNAFKERNTASILKLSADLGHYIADAHVPLHTSSNHNGQKTNQAGIHGFWESRLPELLAEKDWDFYLERAVYIARPAETIWQFILESARAVDSVLKEEAALSRSWPVDQKYAYEWRKQTVVRQYAAAYSNAYHERLAGMAERRMRQSIQAVANFWYTAWVNAGQPNLKGLYHPGIRGRTAGVFGTSTKTNANRMPEDGWEMVDSLSHYWRTQPIKGRSCD
ncbi:MAG TPA: zinc dependent phospholipase C family protein [Flavihumibacter sp.]|jgi:hypothetical protein